MVKYKYINYLLLISSVLLLDFITECSSFRLPGNTVPKLYKLNLDPHLDDDQFTFDGSSSVIFKVLQPTDTVTVHSSELIDLDKEYTKLVCSNGTVRRPISQEWKDDFEFLDIKFEHTLSIDEYTIDFQWTGRSDDPPRKVGFSQHKQYVNGTLENTVATYFEPRGARTVFPCWDEPGLKAEFSIGVRHKTNYKAISNMPIKEVVPTDDEEVLTTFKKTPPMATYQLTIVVGLLEGLTNEYKNMTYWIQPGQTEQLRFNAELSPLIVAALANYTGTPFPLPKLDTVYVYDFPAEAIEHWGAITFSTKYLHGPGTQRSNKDFDIAMTVAHEIAHQWFGDLVTHKWWNDIWLTESFATYFSYKILNDISSRWQAKERFAIYVTNKWSFNAHLYSQFNHAIGLIPDKLTGPEEKFESTLYNSGAAVVQMLEHILSENVFQNGIRKYFNKHKFSSVETDDLWSSLQEAHDESQPASHLDIKQIMEPWLHQKAHPLLNVTRNYDTGVVTITQTDAVDPKSSSKWKVPITFATSSNPNCEDIKISHWLEPTTSSLEIHGVNKNDWIILNLQSKDFYQVTYDLENWKLIAAYLNSENYSKIHMFNRAQLLYDIPKMDLSKVGTVELSMNIVSYLSREVSPFPLRVGLDLVKSYAQQFRRTPLYDLYQQFALYHLRKIIDRVGYEVREDDDDWTRMMRYKLLDVLCELGDEECRMAARAKFNKYVSDGADELVWDDFKDDENQWMLCYGLAAANETIWDIVQPRIEIADYFRCTKNTTLIDNYLMKVINGQISSFYDILIFAMESIVAGPEDNFDFALDFYIRHIDDIRQLYTRKNSKVEVKISKTLKKLASKASTKSHERKLLEFLNGDGANIKDLKESVDQLSQRLNAVGRSTDKLIEAILNGHIASIE